MISRRQFLLRSAAAGAGLTALSNRIGAVEAKKILELAGTSANSLGYYTRMFPGLVRKPSRPHEEVEEGLKELGHAMVDKDPPVSPESEPELPPAGYTYFGQFIDHDLTFDLTPLERADVEETKVRNFRAPFLDLDHVYGGGPNLSPFLYEIGNHDAERFLIGRTIKAGDWDASDDDVPRNSQGTALVGDPRQDENLILAQLHVAFLKLHNFVIAQTDLSLYRREGESDFVAAQRAVRWHYQWVVRHDYLRYILYPTIFEQLHDRLEKPKRERPPVDFSIPIEFSCAVFRFGHSMVRDVYKTGINKKHGRDVKLADFFRQTGLQGSASFALPAEWIVCWNRFFFISQKVSGHINRARKIDTQIANQLHHLDEPPSSKGVSPVAPFSVQLKGERLEPSLPVRTLTRGFRMNLPSGEDVAAEIARQRPDLGIRVLTEDEIVSGPHKDILTNPKYGFRKNTPLWYYILKEAEVTEVPVGEEKKRGTCLGPVGSWIVADVIISGLAADADSYFRAADNWKPTLSIRSEHDAVGQLLAVVFPKQKDDKDPRCKRA